MVTFQSLLIFKVRIALVTLESSLISGFHAFLSCDFHAAFSMSEKLSEINFNTFLKNPFEKVLAFILVVLRIEEQQYIEMDLQQFSRISDICFISGKV